MKKLAKVFLSLMLVMMCSFSFVGCSGNNNGNNNGNGGGSSNNSVYGTYYFSDVVIDGYSGDGEDISAPECNAYAGWFGSTLKIEENKLTINMIDDGIAREIVVNLIKEGERFKVVMENTENPEESMFFYLDVSNGVATMPVVSEYIIDGMFLQFVKDKTNVAKKYDYRLKTWEGNLGVAGSSNIIYSDFINIDENNLTRYDCGYKYEYSMTKNGDIYTLTFLSGDNENPSFETATLKMVETGLEISYVGSNGEITLIYINI